MGSAAFAFIDWLHSTGQTWWQTLPTGMIDLCNSPYLSLSSRAGNPWLIDPEALVARGWIEPDLWQSVSTRTPQDQLHRSDYSIGVAQRRELLEAAQRGFNARATPGERNRFSGFVRREHRWLSDFALFMTLHEQHSAQAWTFWTDWRDAALRRREPDALARAKVEHAEAIAFWCFTQWLFFEQWAQLRSYANERGVRLVGDLPFYPAYHSAEVWCRPDLFDLDEDGLQLTLGGVPPDANGRNGQCWGSVTYRWQNHVLEGFEWWCERVGNALARCDLLRLDHFRALHGFWAINAKTAEPADGAWRPAPGAQLLLKIDQVFDSPPLFVEDLGYVTAEVTLLRQRFRLPGVSVAQYGFAAGRPNNAYLPTQAGADMVLYTGTFDNNTTAGWFASDDGVNRPFFDRYFDGASAGKNAADDAPAVAAHLMARAVLMSGAGLAILPMQDVLQLGAEARMNIPGQAFGCWEWRMRATDLTPAHSARLAEWTWLGNRVMDAP